MFHDREIKLTSVVILMNSRLDVALLGIVDGLSLESSAGGTHASRGIHGSLESIALPTEDVISMLTQASRVTSAENERLTA